MPSEVRDGPFLSQRVQHPAGANKLIFSTMTITVSKQTCTTCAMAQPPLTALPKELLHRIAFDALGKGAVYGTVLMRPVCKPLRDAFAKLDSEVIDLRTHSVPYHVIRDLIPVHGVQTAFSGAFSAQVGPSERVPVGRVDLPIRGLRRAPRGSQVGPSERVPVGLLDLPERGPQRAPRGSQVGPRERVPVGRVDVLVRGPRRAPRGSQVGPGERVPVGREDVLVRGPRRAARGSQVGPSERVPVGQVDPLVRGPRRAPRGSQVGPGERVPSAARCRNASRLIWGL